MVLWVALERRGGLNLHPEGEGGTCRRRSSLEDGERRRGASVREREAQQSRRGCPRSRTSTGRRGRRRQGHGCTVAFGHDAPMLVAASPVSASARERSRAKRRGWWRGAAVVGELWLEHAPNRGTGATQSASNACQAPCPHAVTTLACPKRCPNVAKPFLG